MSGRHPQMSPSIRVLAACIAVSFVCACKDVVEPTKCILRTDCPDGSTCENQLCRPLAAGESVCSRDDQCLSTEYCLDTICHARTPATAQCRRHADCGTRYCKPTGVCVDCLNFEHCSPGDECRPDGTCGRTATACISDANCAGLKCKVDSGKCVQCLNGNDCLAGQSCRQNTCYAPAGSTVPCTQQPECDKVNKICDLAAKVCVDCKNDPECGAGRVCAVGSCAPEPQPGGCTSRAQCNGIACYQGTCQDCLDDDMCADPVDAGQLVKICDWPNSGRCVDLQCLNAYACPTEEGCYSGHCGPCWYEWECRDGEWCDQDTYQCADLRAGFGDDCTTGACAAGLVCLKMGGLALCTRACIGSGLVAGSDCPAGHACYDFDTGPMDGVQLCVPARQLPSSVPGQPFTQAPGDACLELSQQCVSGYCVQGSCARGCLGDRDCAPGSVCYAESDVLSVPDGRHYCFASDLEHFTANGDACTSGAACDSGICTGSCDDGKLCNEATGCSSGQCHGVCAPHCRTSADCSVTQVCAPWPMHTLQGVYSGYTPVCRAIQGNGQAVDGATCSESAECASESCVKGICTALCGTDADCQAGLRGRKCTPVSFTSDTGAVLYSAAFCL